MLQLEQPQPLLNSFHTYPSLHKWVPSSHTWANKMWTSCLTYGGAIKAAPSPADVDCQLAIRPSFTWVESQVGSFQHTPLTPDSSVPGCQDDVTVLRDFAGEPGCIFAGVFAGQGERGLEAAQHACGQLPQAIAADKRIKAKDCSKKLAAIREAYEALHSLHALQKGGDTSGTAACFALLAGRKLLVGCAGSPRALLASRTQDGGATICQPSGRNHHLSLEDSAHGSSNDESGHSSRALDMLHLTEYDVTSDTHFLVLASSGVWSVFSSEDVVQFVDRYRKQPCQGMTAAEALTLEAHERWKAVHTEALVEDASAVVLFFGPPPAFNSLQPRPAPKHALAASSGAAANQPYALWASRAFRARLPPQSHFAYLNEEGSRAGHVEDSCHSGSLRCSSGSGSSPSPEELLGPATRAYELYHPPAMRPVASTPFQSFDPEADAFHTPTSSPLMLRPLSDHMRRSWSSPEGGAALPPLPRSSYSPLHDLPSPARRATGMQAIPIPENEAVTRSCSSGSLSSLLRPVRKAYPSPRAPEPLDAASLSDPRLSSALSSSSSAGLEGRVRGGLPRAASLTALPSPDAIINSLKHTKSWSEKRLSPPSPSCEDSPLALSSQSSVFPSGMANPWQQVFHQQYDEGRAGRGRSAALEALLSQQDGKSNPLVQTQSAPTGFLSEQLALLRGKEPAAGHSRGSPPAAQRTGHDVLASLQQAALNPEA